MSAGTKTVQQMLVGRVQDSTTTCSSLAAQSRAARLAELEEIHNRWKNGVLRDDSSSDESGVSGRPVSELSPLPGDDGWLGPLHPVVRIPTICEFGVFIDQYWAK